MTPDQASPIFFAYASDPSLRAETMRDTIIGINGRGGMAVGWEDLEVDGTLIISKICSQIDASSSVVAEISSMNPNVLFELGYAIARNKPVVLAFDDSDTEASRLWNEIGALASIGRTEYGGNSERLISQILGSPPNLTSPLFDTLVAGARPREANAVFAPSAPTKISAAVHLTSLLERQSHLMILGSSEDLIIAPLQFYAREIYRSSAAIFHLLQESRRFAAGHNARASLLAGFAHGLELPVLMVVQSEYRTPLDYRDLLFQYETSAKLQEKVKVWLDTIPKAPGTQRRLGKLALDIELPIRTFGQYVAEYETDELDDYYIQTSEFTEILRGEARVFVGRKGTGKTATMSQVSKELARSRDVLAVPIKPSSYELSGLVGILGRFGSPAHAEYFLMTCWMYLIYSEIALRIVAGQGVRALSMGEQAAVDDLESLLRKMEISSDEDLSARLEKVIAIVGNALDGVGSTTNDVLAVVANGIKSDHLARIRKLSQNALSGYKRIAVLIDNLDKNWEKGSNFDAISQFILSLLTTSGKIEKEFQRSDSGGRGISATLTVFVRTDIFDVVSGAAREPDKIGARTVNWDDEHLLVRVLEERYAANRTQAVDGAAMWEELFCSEVRGLTTRDYYLWRALRRPRDFVFFANASLTTAINRRHSVVEASDICFAEAQYSRFAIEALLVESESQDYSLNDLLYEFAGLGSTLTASELERVLRDTSNFAAVRDWLIAASFLGLERRDGEFEYVEGDAAAKMKMKVAERNAAARAGEMRFRVHPAFRPFLEMVDDDLHAG